MKFFALLALGASVFFTGLTAVTSDANAVVCARGVYRAGCVGPHGAVGVRRAPVVVAPRRGVVVRRRVY